MDEPFPHTGNRGTPLYESLEILFDENYSSKCDVWSAGLVFYQILFGNHPFLDLREKKNYTLTRYRDLLKKKPLSFPDKPRRSECLKILIGKMLEKEEKNRCSWQEVFAFFEKEVMVLGEKEEEIYLSTDVRKLKCLNKKNVWTS